MVPNTTLADVLDELTREGELYHSLEDQRVECFACAHRCKIRDGQRGICKVRFNRHGKLYVPWGYAVSVAVDPIEKKPFYHVLPGSGALSFGMLGCDLHCSYCQNWITSQALRDPYAGIEPKKIDPDRMVELAVKYHCDVVVSTYNEPLITSEWAKDIFVRAKKHHFLCGYVSNGNATREVLEYLRPVTDCYKIDLKTFQDKQYRKLGCTLQAVLDTIEMAHNMGFWVEIVTLLVPGFNDSESEIRDIARFIQSVSPEIPWHVTAFHRDYKMTEPRDTTPQDLLRAAEIGKEEGLWFVYAGNIPGAVKDFEDTFCPNCGESLIRRFGFHIVENRLREGKCPACSSRIPGLWTKPSASHSPSH